MWYAYVLLGGAAGVASGFLGLGGGFILIPALVYFFNFTQHQAQGTTLAMMIPPIGLLAALRYYYQGNVKIGVAALMCAGFFVGGLIGAQFVDRVPDLALRRIFGAMLLLVSLRMLFGK